MFDSLEFVRFPLTFTALLFSFFTLVIVLFGLLESKTELEKELEKEYEILKSELEIFRENLNDEKKIE